jgi:hypothetical protein
LYIKFCGSRYIRHPLGQPIAFRALTVFACLRKTLSVTVLRVSFENPATSTQGPTSSTNIMCFNTFYALNSTKSHPLHRQPVILFYFRWSTYSPSDVCDIPGFAPEGQGQNLLASTAIVFSCHGQSTLIKRPALVKLQLVAERTLAVLSSIAPIWPYLALSARQDLWDLTNVGHPNALLKCHLSIANHCETFLAKALKCTCKMRSAPFCTH